MGDFRKYSAAQLIARGKPTPPPSISTSRGPYRAMFLEEVSSWNLRDRHMAETLDALVTHLDRNGSRAKVAVWEHNSHLGDARATDMGQRGELNVGQLTREKYGQDAVLVGFTTHHGSRYGRLRLGQAG